MSKKETRGRKKGSRVLSKITLKELNKRFRDEEEIIVGTVWALSRGLEVNPFKSTPKKIEAIIAPPPMVNEPEL